ncbi:MAG: metalloregulator ArsR/SmtB family transcription factor [Nitrospirae bacterium]|nr:metalloregulator ArsR/SmtB family transcription factor [Nitrospirota bacterium]
MKEITEIFKLLSDESRLRILMLLEKRELCVCQIMGVLNMSQPLVSRNLSLLAKSGFLAGRREGKLMFYRIKRNLTKKNLLILSVLKELLKDDRVLLKDFRSLKECEEFQKKTGKCDMETFKAFMKQKIRKRSGRKNDEVM